MLSAAELKVVPASAPQHPALAYGRRECPREPDLGGLLALGAGSGVGEGAGLGVRVMPGSAVRSLASE